MWQWLTVNVNENEKPQLLLTRPFQQYKQIHLQTHISITSQRVISKIVVFTRFVFSIEFIIEYKNPTQLNKMVQTRTDT